MPCPISEWLAMTVTVSSGAMRTNALGAKTPAPAAASSRGAAPNSGTYAAMHKPPPIVAVVFRNSRRPRDLESVTNVELAGVEFVGVGLIGQPSLSLALLPRAQRRDELPAGCADTFRNGRCCPTWPRRYRCR